MRRRVRKSRQKEAAGAADAGLMQIEWSEGEVLKFAGVVKAVAADSAQPCKDDLLDEVSPGGDRKKMSGCNGDTLRRDALKRADGAVCGRVISCRRDELRQESRGELGCYRQNDTCAHLHGRQLEDGGLPRDGDTE